MRPPQQPRSEAAAVQITNEEILADLLYPAPRGDVTGAARDHGGR